MTDKADTRSLPLLFNRFGLPAAIVIVETSLPDQDSVHAAILGAVNEWVLHTNDGLEAFAAQGTSLSIEHLILNRDLLDSTSLSQLLHRAGVAVRYAQRTTAMTRYPYQDDLLTAYAKSTLSSRECTARETLG